MRRGEGNTAPLTIREGRKRVTLIAGLMCGTSIVFAADSEESGVLRKSVSKLSHSEQSAERALSGSPSIIVGGAGNGTIADYASQRIIAKTSSLHSLAEIEDTVAEILRDVFQNHVPLHPNPDDANIELLIGVKSLDAAVPVLYSTEGATLVRRGTYHVCGTGSLIEYVLDRLYGRWMSVEDGISAALTMLQLAKSYVNGVGGDSNIAILQENGVIERKISWELGESEAIAKQYSFLTGKLLLATFRTSVSSSDADFIEELRSFSKELKALRLKKKDADQTIKSIMSVFDPPDSGQVDSNERNERSDRT